MIEELIDRVGDTVTTQLTGTVKENVGSTIVVGGFPAPLGSTVEIERLGMESLFGEVIGFKADMSLVASYGEPVGIHSGARVWIRSNRSTVKVSDHLLGRVIDAQGEIIDGYGDIIALDQVPIDKRPPRPIDRPRINEPLSTGIRAIDSLLTVGRGQRLGIFAGPGIGKSVLLGMMARNTEADVNVIALVGERGREVREFLERDLGSEGLKKSIIVVATSDEPALLRIKAAMTATAIAEYFRDQGKNVLLVMDSLTRFALAQREIGLSAGEPPTTKGFPPSVFSMLPKLVERAGRTTTGSITGFYSVLVESDDPTEPISDAARGLLDGHIMLSRSLASKGHFPAIDILESISRVMPDITDENQLSAASQLRSLIATYRENEDLINIGAYKPGSNPRVDLAIQLNDRVNHFLKQGMNEPSNLSSAVESLLNITYQAKQNVNSENQSEFETA